MDLGDLVVIEKREHPYHGKEGKIVGRRGNRAPGDPWYLVYVMMRGRSYLVPGSMLKLVKKKTADNENLLWPLTGRITKEKPS